MTAPDRPPLPYSFREVRAALQLAQWGLYDRLGLVGARDGEHFLPRNPTRDDRKPGSFVIYTDPVRAGGFVEYAGVGARGDILGLIQYVAGLRAPIDAYFWSCEFLGWKTDGAARPRSREAVEAERVAAANARLKAEQKAAAERDGRARKAFGWWLACKPFEGSLAEVYLRQARGAPLDRLKKSPGALRFTPAAEHVDGDTGEVTAWPCMIAAMNAYGRGVRAVHRTFLAADGMGKAPIPNAKKMWGDVAGCAVRLSNGASGISAEAAARKGVTGEVLCVAEGIEKALFAACAQPDWRAWSAGSLSLMAGLEWPPSVGQVVLIKDNDEAPEAVAAFERAHAHWQAMAAGRQLAVWAAPPGFKDLDEWARR